MSTGVPLLTEVRADGTAWVTLNRPEQRNALDAAQWERLAEALTRLAGDPSVRCLVLTGAGGAFGAGGDLTSMLAELATEGGAATFRARIHRCLAALYGFPVPTLARINGPAIGGGLELAGACDLRIASRAARFGMPAARFGMVMAYPDFARLAAIVGVDRARFLALTGEVIDGEEAFRTGLIHALVSPEDLDAATDRMTRRLQGMEPAAVAWFRQAAATLQGPAAPGRLRDFEEECLLRPEFRRRVEEFMQR